MLMGAGLLSKFVELVAKKLIGKHLDLALDEKRRACYTFVELLFTLQGFYAVTEGFVEQISESSLGSLVTINLLCRNGYTIKALTMRFFELHEDLWFTLDVLDPTLAEVFDQVHTFKGSVFHAIADSITIPEEEPRNQFIVYRRPTNALLAIDMETFYESLKTSSNDQADRPWLWSSDLIELPDYEAAFASVRVKTDDEEKLSAFVKDLKDQAQLLRTAVEKLRTLIRDNFTLEEVLASSRKLSV